VHQPRAISSRRRIPPERVLVCASATWSGQPVQQFVNRRFTLFAGRRRAWRRYSISSTVRSRSLLCLRNHANRRRAHPLLSARRVGVRALRGDWITSSSSDQRRFTSAVRTSRPKSLSSFTLKEHIHRGESPYFFTMCSTSMHCRAHPSGRVPPFGSPPRYSCPQSRMLLCGNDGGGAGFTQRSREPTTHREQIRDCGHDTRGGEPNGWELSPDGWARAMP